MVKKSRFATVQDYLDCDNVRLTAVWAKRSLWSDQAYKAKMRALHSTPEYKKKMSLVKKKLWSNSEYKAKMLANGKFYKIWSNSEYKAKMLARRNTPEYRKMLREKRWSIDYVRLPKNNAKKIRSKILHPDGRWSKEARIKHSECVKNYWSDPEYRTKMLARRNTPEYKKMLSDRIRLKQKIKAAQ